MSKTKCAFNSQSASALAGSTTARYLENVGGDSYHHTFEMLDNWSFGDYFKARRRRPSSFSRALLIWLELDLDAKQFWIDIGVLEDRLIPGNTKDNFGRWVQPVHAAHAGPFLPSASIYTLISLLNPDALKIWNNVFIQFGREDDGLLCSLPSKHVVTGLGFAHLISVIQDCLSNHDTHVFLPILDEVQALTGVRRYEGRFSTEDVDVIDTAYRVVADHVHMLAFALSEGGASTDFGVSIGLFFLSLMPVVVGTMGGAFLKITKRVYDIKEVDDDDENFSRTFDRGEKLFDHFTGKARASFMGRTCGELGLTNDDEEFEAVQAHSKEVSKSDVKKGVANVVKLDVHGLARRNTTWEMSTAAAFMAIFYYQTFVASTSAIPDDADFGILLDRTSFYAESGGQEYDMGNIVVNGVADFEEPNVQVYDGCVLHTRSLKYGAHVRGDAVVASYGELRR
ncbi:hypothetical protein HYPSUDRAFT_202496 [Hypholoma sublateritium FD-334 SS-4]|uniref:alanine--tRNA ligase n=1 Tax=Hypholoma sublateritium (strain FD-334 SS-4) TaxID=945553 RepID=A0A0D2NSZ2_HYPSF|nr:hypothetical protein HYPSUDRAFT_202468 [Hypholoma sublateritium FD-334 SS-4]KJA22004.1 hypothetical protein HYPSUDRAFT_202496 [Hypholoma sublateritium FD-334 SS-4]